MQLRTIISVFTGIMIMECAVQGKKPLIHANQKAGSIQKKTHTPQLIESSGNSYFVWKYKGRIYVIGDTKMSEKFKKYHHLPYTKTILGAGPKGETVIFEVKKKEPSYVEQLVERYSADNHREMG